MNLYEAYKQGLMNDPTFKAAEAEWLATRENSPIARSALLPQITAKGSFQRQHVEQSFYIDTSNDTNNTQFQLSATQNLFNYKAWMEFKTANLQVRQAQATYFAAAEDLMMRVSSAYFAVLQAYDTYTAARSQTKSLSEQLRQTQNQYQQGVVAAYTVDQIRASHDASLSQQVAAKIAVADRLEELRAITGCFYSSLDGINEDLPLLPPIPNDINEWITIAGRQNYNIQAANFASLASHENIKTQFAQHLPVVQAIAGYSYQNISSYQLGLPGENRSAAFINRTSSVGIQANLPIYQGGLVNAQTRQAAYQYAQVAAQRDQTFRGVLTQTRESFLGVLSGITRLSADKQSVISNTSSLKSINAGFAQGVNTTFDVLQQQASWFNAVTTFSTDQYNYLLSALTLKSAAGTLDGCDLAVISRWLNRPINLTDFNFNRGVAYTPPPIVAPTPPIKATPPTKPAKKSKPMAQKKNKAKHYTHKTKKNEKKIA